MGLTVQKGEAGMDQRDFIRVMASAFLHNHDTLDVSIHNVTVFDITWRVRR